MPQTDFRTEYQITRRLTNQILHLAQLSPKQEICGLIGGKNNKPTTCYPISNIAENPQHRFLLDPEQQIAVMKAMRNNDEEFFAIYHSHPEAPAQPSSRDLAAFAYPDALYLIISLNTKGVLEMRGFKINNEKAQEVILTLLEN